MKLKTYFSTVLTLFTVGGAISALGQNAIIEQAREGSTNVNNPDFVFNGFASGTTGDHTSAPGVNGGSASRYVALPASGPNTNFTISPNGGHGTISNTATGAGTSALQIGTTYLVSVSMGNSPTVNSTDLIVSITDTGMSGIDTINGTTTTAFRSPGANNVWNAVGYITPGTTNPTITFSYLSGSNSRWDVDSILFSPVPQSPLIGTGTFQYWNTGSPGGSGTWDTTTSNWNTSSTGSGAQEVYTQADISDFNGTAGTVTIQAGGITTDGGLEFDQTGYVITNGTLTLGSSPSSAGTNIAIGLTYTATINSTISAPYGLCLDYLGTLNLGAAPTLGGTVTLSGGKLQLQPGVNASFPSLTGSGALGLGSNTLTLGDSTTNNKYSGIISDAGSSTPGYLVMQGPGIQTLSGNSTFYGATTISGGALTIAADGALGTAPASVVANQLVLSNGGRLDASGAFTLNANRGISLGAGGGMISTPNSGTAITFAGPISGSGSLTVPSGTLDLKGTSNTFSGGLYITATPVDTGGNNLCSVRFDAATGTAGTGKIFVSPTTAVNCTLRNFNTATNVVVTNAMELDLWTNTQVNAQIYLAGGATSNAVYPITFSGNINGAAPVNIGLDTAGGSSNPGGVVNLSGSNSLWTGGATLQAGTLGIGSTNALGTGGLFLVPQGPAGVVLATTPLSGTNALTNSIGINTQVASLTFGGSNSLEFAGPIFLYASSTFYMSNTAATIFSGSIADFTPGSDDTLAVAGSGTLTLTGSNSYDGITMVTSGTLLVNNTTGSGTSTNAVTVSSGATLGGTGTIAGTVDDSGTIAPGNGGPGTLTTADETWEPGASYNFAINKAGGTAGANPGWTQANITGGLNINANSGSPFTINLTSLTSSNTPGLVSDFNDAHSYSWSIAHTIGGITNFATNSFTVNTNNFLNNLGGGSFSINTNTTDVLLVFTTAVVSPPTISSIHVSGTNLTISGTGGSPGGPYNVLTTTNVATPLTNWVTLGSSNFDGSGNFTFNGSISTTNSQQYYTIEEP